MTDSPFLDIRVYVRPSTQGSKNARVIPAKGDVPARAIMWEKSGRALIDFREAIRHETIVALPAPWAPVSGPVRAALVFSLPKPASAPKRRRTWPLGARSGDLDKFTRAVLDALTHARVWTDDAVCVELYARKDYPSVEMDAPGVWIRLWEVRDVPPPVPEPDDDERDTLVDEGAVPLPGM